MRYDMRIGAEIMNNWQLATVNIINAESASRFHSRNPFASGGVYEDPATGAAAAALVAYLNEIGVPGAKSIQVLQGEDMGIPCLITANAPTEVGRGARVQGNVRRMPEGV
jgi:predicted PhzF superfamily epimerase YddE/YHI9